MPTPATEASGDVFTIADWQEFLAGSDPSGADVLSNDGSEATLLGWVPANKVRSALGFFLGYSYCPGDGKTLNRVLPARHPVWPNLYVRSVQAHRHYPIANPANPGNAPYVDAVDVADGPKITKTGSYVKSWFTLHFAPMLFDLIEDVDAVLEFERYCEIYHRAEPNLETINAGVGRYLVFTEGDPATKEFPGEVSEYKISTALTILWHQVPYDYVFDENGFAKKIIQGVGRVNSDTFLGCPRGTLLCYPPRFRRYTQPVRTTDGGNLYAVDVEMNFGHFDPEPAIGYPSTGGGGGSAGRGWQLMPWVNGGNVDDTYGAGGIGWYHVSRPDGSDFLPYYDFDKLFEGWNHG